MKFYTFDQNNSGGYFIEDYELGIGEYIIIEAETAEKANEQLDIIGNRMGESFWDYCSCCGTRWGGVSDSDGKDTPMIYSKSVYEEKTSWCEKVACIHYADGRIETVE